MTIAPILPVYRRSAIRMERGEGCYLIDAEGKRYLDFAAGIAVNSFGHNHPHLNDALNHQAEKLWHCSNQFTTGELEKFATRLTDATFADSVYFCSSGTEAVEAGIKFLRRYHYETGEPYRHRIVTFEGGFHGRTYGGLSAGSSETAKLGFGQMLPGFDRVRFNDIDAVRAAVTKNTAGILIEPIQGEGGVQVADLTFLKQLRELCDEEEILLMCDEVQCGYGRPGSFFAFERAGITPDIASSAKGIGGGFPLGATLVTEKVGAALPPGSHGGTYGGNPLAMAVGNAVLDLMLKPGLFEHVRTMGARLLNGLKQIHKNHPGKILDARGVGLMVGLEPSGDARALAGSLLARGLVVSPTVTGVLRFVPPLTVTAAEIDKALAIVDETLKA
ncbi:MAG: aspartate aminotransferase family protein [Alphaproteobacteria bacterium]